MKRMLLSVAAILLTMQANAADLPVYKAVPSVVPYAVPFNWTGLYVGGNVGYGWAAHSFDVLGTDPNSSAFLATLQNPGSLDQTAKGLVGGFQSGYNLQFGSWVLGTEVLFDWTNMNSSAAQTAIANGMQAALASNYRVDWNGAANARLGFMPSPHWLVSAIGGFAFGNISDNASVTCIINCAVNGFSNGPSNTHGGWDAGAEVKYAWSQNVIAGVRYRYVDLGNRSLFVVAPGALPATFNAQTSARWNEAAFTLDWKF